jgi:hypothetical protein
VGGRSGPTIGDAIKSFRLLAPNTAVQSLFNVSTPPPLHIRILSPASDNTTGVDAAVLWPTTHTANTSHDGIANLPEFGLKHSANIPIFTRNQEIKMSEMPVVPVLGEEYTRPVVTGQFPRSITRIRTRSLSDRQLNLHSRFRLYFVYFLTTCCENHVERAVAQLTMGVCMVAKQFRRTLQ